jgi:phosphoribosylaminoimidazole carboxylase (NCAIR synthetase)
VLATAITFSACTTNEEMHSITFYDYMYTSITISLYGTEQEADIHFQALNDIYETYDSLTNIYQGLEEILGYDNVFVHLYGKLNTKPFRKMGHITILGDTVSEAKEKAVLIKSKIKVISN